MESKLSRQAIRAAGQRNAEGQDRPHPRSAWTTAIRTGSAGKDGAIPAHLTRTMPLLRQSHARDRNLQARAKTNVARTTSGTGHMTEYSSPIMRSNRQQQAAPGRSGCAELRKRSNLATLPATWGPPKASRRAKTPPNIAQKAAKRSAETTVPATASTQSP